VFRIRLFTPPVIDANGWRHAGGELVIGGTRLCFLVDLDSWTPADYAHQWREGIARLAAGAASTALMTAYRGRDARAHVLWALWRDETHIHIQEQSVLQAELDSPFEPADPYEQVGDYVATAVNGLPIPEWHVPIDGVHDVSPWLRRR
jgi:CdiI N-terminal domain